MCSLLPCAFLYFHSNPNSFLYTTAVWLTCQNSTWCFSSEEKIKSLFCTCRSAGRLECELKEKSPLTPCDVTKGTDSCHLFGFCPLFLCRGRSKKVLPFLQDANSFRFFFLVSFSFSLAMLAEDDGVQKMGKWDLEEFGPWKTFCFTSRPFFFFSVTHLSCRNVAAVMPLTTIKLTFCTSCIHLAVCLACRETLTRQQVGTVFPIRPNCVKV